MVLDHLLKSKNEYKHLKRGDFRYVSQEKLGKACFQHGVACPDFKNLPRWTACDKGIYYC